MGNLGIGDRGSGNRGGNKMIMTFKDLLVWQEAMNLKEYLHFLSIANGSVTELETHILIAERLNLLSKEKTKYLQAQLQTVGKLLSAMRKSLIPLPSGVSELDEKFLIPPVILFIQRRGIQTVGTAGRALTTMFAVVDTGHGTLPFGADISGNG